jgi:hypothetical protein
LSLKVENAEKSHFYLYGEPGTTVAIKIEAEGHEKKLDMPPWCSRHGRDNPKC